jgi:hypothetical protein
LYTIKYIELNTMFRRVLKFAISAVLLLTGGVLSQQQPSMIYMLNRHGVSPCIDPPAKETGSQLFDSSYERNYVKGQRIRQIYPSILSPGYKYNEIHVNASAWQRTIATAHGMLHGLFPSLQNNTASVPVFTNSWEFDYTLYNYDTPKCPNFESDWYTFQQTTEFKAKVQQYANLTSYLTSINKPAWPYKLSNIYSIWEVYNTIKRYPETGLRGFAPIDDYTMSVLDEAVAYVESNKWSEKIAKDYFGNTFLAAVKYRMEMHINKDLVFGKKMAMSFAHYPNILFTLASLGYTGPISKIIPGYNSALVFELYNETTNKINYPSGWGVKVRYYEGNKQWSSHTSITDGYPIALGKCQEGSECEIDYSVFWGSYKTKSLKDWCHSCGSDLWMCQGAKDVVPNCPTCSTISQSDTQNIQIANLVIACAILFIILVSFIRSFGQINSINPTSVVTCGKPTHEAIPMSVV